VDERDLALELSRFFDSLLENGKFERAEAMALTHQWFEITCIPTLEEDDGDQDD
jgi:hypothetical protein